MSSKAIEELKQNRKQDYKRKRSQIPYALIAIIVSLFIYLLLNKNSTFGTFWIIGILFGITLQRSRICFAASFRDPVLVGSTSLLKAILIALMVSTVGFAIVDGINPAISIKHMGQVYPVGLHTILGAILFGIGMVIAGGCASGFLMRIGEGFIIQIVVLFGFAVGALLGTWHFPFWHKIFIERSPAVFLPDYFGYFVSTIGQVLILLLLYFIAHWYDKKNNIMSM